MLEEHIEKLKELYGRRPPIAETFELMGTYYLYDTGTAKLIECNREKYIILESIIEGYTKKLLTLENLYENQEAFQRALEDVIALIEVEDLFKIRKII